MSTLRTEKTVWVVIQEGGSSTEAYATSYEREDQAVKAIDAHHKASYRTAGPFPMWIVVQGRQSYVAEPDVLALLEDVKLSDFGMRSGARGVNRDGRKPSRRSSAMAKNRTLTGADWAEIYYALDGKKTRLEQGEYGPEDEPGSHAAWVDHLQILMHMIGPDGWLAASRGVAPSKEE